VVNAIPCSIYIMYQKSNVILNLQNTEKLANLPSPFGVQMFTRFQLQRPPDLPTRAWSPAGGSAVNTARMDGLSTYTQPKHRHLGVIMIIRLHRTYYVHMWPIVTDPAA